MKKLFLLCVMLLCVPAFANTVDLSNLTEVQQAELQKIVAEKALENTKNGALPVKESEALKTANKWAEVGKGLGQGIGAVAKEVGVAVNDFVKTPVGKIAMFLIAWHFIGADILHLLTAVTLVFIGIPFTVRMFRTYMTRGIHWVEVTKTTIFGKPYSTKVPQYDMSPDASFAMWISCALLLGGAIILIVTV